MFRAFLAGRGFLLKTASMTALMKHMGAVSEAPELERQKFRQEGRNPPPHAEDPAGLHDLIDELAKAPGGDGVHRTVDVFNIGLLDLFENGQVPAGLGKS